MQIFALLIISQIWNYLKPFTTLNLSVNQRWWQFAWEWCTPDGNILLCFHVYKALIAVSPPPHGQYYNQIAHPSQSLTKIFIILSIFYLFVEHTVEHMRPFCCINNYRIFVFVSNNFVKYRNALLFHIFHYYIFFFSPSKITQHSEKYLQKHRHGGQCKQLTAIRVWNFYVVVVVLSIVCGVLCAAGIVADDKL